MFNMEKQTLSIFLSLMEQVYSLLAGIQNTQKMTSIQQDHLNIVVY